MYEDPHPNYSPTDANCCTGWWHRPPGPRTLCDGHGIKCHEPDSTKSSFIKRLYSDSPPHTLAGRRVPCGPCVRGDGMFLETERAYIFICNIVAILSIILLLYSLKFTFSILNLLEIWSIRSTTILGGKNNKHYAIHKCNVMGECETLVWSNSWEVTVMRV